MRKAERTHNIQPTTPNPQHTTQSTFFPLTFDLFPFSFNLLSLNQPNKGSADFLTPPAQKTHQIIARSHNPAKLPTIWNDEGQVTKDE
jgi:hypothetical protein